jgi:hypothetical protein
MTEEEIQIRLKNAIILLADLHTYTVGDITLNAKDKDHLSVTGWTNSIALENISKQKALEELSETKLLFDKMVKCSNEFATFIKNRQIEYRLGFDYGMGGIGLCSETNGQLVWLTKLKQ